MAFRGTHKKGKFSNSSKSKIQYQTVKDLDPHHEDKNWIGDIHQSENGGETYNQYFTQYNTKNQPTERTQFKKQQTKIPTIETINKSPTELIQDILKGLNMSEDTHLSPFYTKDSEQTVTELLTNRNKLGLFIKNLQNNMGGLDRQIVRNYEVLIILLKEIHSNDVEVKKNQEGLQIKFNRSTMQKQQNQIQRLQKEVEEKDNQMKEIIEGYEAIIRNFNEVIQKLIDERNDKIPKKNLFHH